jgi:hypothetical protein
MVKDLIRAASQPSSAGYFTTAIIMVGVYMISFSNVMLIIAGCFLIGGVMKTVSNWAHGRLDDQTEGDSTAKSTIGETVSSKVADQLLAFRKLSARATAVREQGIVNEIDSLAKLSRRLDQLGTIKPQDIESKVKQVYAASWGSLQRAVELAEAQQQMQTPEIRARVAISRHKLLVDVAESLRLLERTTDELQAARLDPDSSEQSLSQLRSELDQSLSIAKRTEERMKEMENEEYLRLGTKA